MRFSCILTIVIGCSSTSNAPPMPDAAPDAQQGITLQMDHFQIPPGAEYFKCQNVANPFGGMDAEVTGFQTQLVHGAHHMVVVDKANLTSDSLHDCSLIELNLGAPNTQVAFGGQGPSTQLTFPAGSARSVLGTHGFELQIHMLNTTTMPIEVDARVILTTADPASITQHVGFYFFSKSDLSIPPGGPTQVSKSCNFPPSSKLIALIGHLHSHGTDISVSSGGNVIYDTMNWREPPFQQYPTPDVQTLTWTCTYMNDTNSTLVFGDSALTNEMCIIAGYYYPLPSGTSPYLTCF